MSNNIIKKRVCIDLMLTTPYNLCFYVCMCVFMCFYVCVFVCLLVCVYVCLYVCVFLCVFCMLYRVCIFSAQEGHRQAIFWGGGASFQLAGLSTTKQEPTIDLERFTMIFRYLSHWGFGEHAIAIAERAFHVR